MTPLANRRVLFISYNGMLDPLGQSQVIPYLKELARAGVNFTLLSFERSHAYTQEGRERSDELRRELASSGIDWHWLLCHKTPSLPATSYDVLAGRVAEEGRYSSSRHCMKCFRLAATFKRGDCDLNPKKESE